MYKHIVFGCIVICNSVILNAMNVRCNIPIRAVFQKLGHPEGNWFTQPHIMDKFRTSQEHCFPEVMHHFSDKELSTYMVHNNTHDINTFLKQNNFDIHVDHKTQNQINIAAIMRIANKWKSNNVDKSSILYDKKLHPAIAMTSYSKEQLGSITQFDGFSTQYPPILNASPRIVLEADNEKDAIHITVSKKFDERCDQEVFSTKILKRILEIFPPRTEESQYYQLLLPTINFDGKPDINWLRGISKHLESNCSQDYLCIDQAEQQVRFRTNANGMLLESAVAITACIVDFNKALALAIQYDVQNFDKSRKIIADSSPLHYLMRRIGAENPLFEGYIDHTDCKK